MSITGAVAVRHIPLSVPDRVFLSMISAEGTNSTDYPTITLSYVNTAAKDVIDYEMLTQVQSAAADFEAMEDAEQAFLRITLYGSPKKELFDFANGHYLHCSIDLEKGNEFFSKVEELGYYVILVNTVEFTYRCLVEDETGEVLEASLNFRSMQ